MNSTVTVDTDNSENVKTDVEKDEQEVGYLSEYARVFDFDNDNYRFSMTINKLFLIQKQQYFNNKLRLEGVVYLNDVYAALGFKRVKRYERTVGWRYNDPNGDNFIDFGVFNRNMPEIHRYHKGCQPIVLDFNASVIA